MAKEKNKTIVMPVGVDAGKKVTLPESNADSIINTFGEWSGVEKTEASDNSAKEIKALQSELVSVTSERDAALAEVDALKAELEELTNPEGGGDE